MARLSPGVLETVQVLRSLAYRSKTPDYRSQLKINSPSICQNRSLGKTSCSTVHVAQCWTWFVKRLTFWPTFEQILGSFRVSISQFLFSNFCCFLWHSTSCLPTTVWMGFFFSYISAEAEVRTSEWMLDSAALPLRRTTYWGSAGMKYVLIKVHCYHLFLFYEISVELQECWTEVDEPREKNIWFLSVFFKLLFNI